MAHFFRITTTCLSHLSSLIWVNTWRPRQNGRHFADDIFKWIFLNENVWIPIKIPLKFVPRGPINNIPAMVQIMAWRRPGAKPLSEPMTVVYWHIYASLGLNKLKTTNAKFNEARFGSRTWHFQAQTTRDRRLCERSHQVGVAEVSVATKYLTRWSLGDFNGILHQWFLKQKF